MVCSPVEQHGFCVWPHTENPLWRLPAASGPVIGDRIQNLGFACRDFKPFSAFS
jgi:hypothetical protein